MKIFERLQEAVRVMRYDKCYNVMEKARNAANNMCAGYYDAQANPFNICMGCPYCLDAVAMKDVLEDVKYNPIK